MNSRSITACNTLYAKTLSAHPRFALLLSLLCASDMARAQQPAAVASFIELPWRYVIGGYRDGEWLDSQTAGGRLAEPVEYRVFTLDAELDTARGMPTESDDVCPDVAMQSVTPAPDLEQAAIGVDTAWNPLPRKPQLLDAGDPVYRQAVTVLLAGRGIIEPLVAITQVLRVDLDGDGTAEELIAATHYEHEAELLAVEPGDYSFVAMQRTVNGAQETQLLSGEFYPETREDAAPNIYRIAAVLDLTGDGVLEVLVHSSYYEGGGLQVWQLQQDRLAGVLVIECGV